MSGPFNGEHSTPCRSANCPRVIRWLASSGAFSSWPEIAPWKRPLLRLTRFYIRRRRDGRHKGRHENMGMISCVRLVATRCPRQPSRKTADGAVEISTTDGLFSGKKVVLFAVPGAFTPTCTLNHLPGYLENRDALKERGVDDIAVHLGQ